MSIRVPRHTYRLTTDEFIPQLKECSTIKGLSDSLAERNDCSSVELNIPGIPYLNQLRHGNDGVACVLTSTAMLLKAKGDRREGGTLIRDLRVLSGQRGLVNISNGEAARNLGLSDAKDLSEFEFSASEREDLQGKGWLARLVTGLEKGYAAILALPMGVIYGGSPGVEHAFLVHGVKLDQSGNITLMIHDPLREENKFLDLKQLIENCKRAKYELDPPIIFSSPNPDGEPVMPNRNFVSRDPGRGIAERQSTIGDQAVKAVEAATGKGTIRVVSKTTASNEPSKGRIKVLGTTPASTGQPTNPRVRVVSTRPSAEPRRIKVVKRDGNL